MNFDDLTSGQLLTGGFLILAVVIAIALVVLFLVALGSVVTNQYLSGGEKLAWVMIVLILQLVGPLAWFAFGRRAAANNAVSAG